MRHSQSCYIRIIHSITNVVYAPQIQECDNVLNLNQMLIVCAYLRARAPLHITFSRSNFGPRRHSSYRYI